MGSRRLIQLGALLACVLTMHASAASAGAQQLGEFSLERWAKLTETQRYQLQIAEKYLREKNHKVALSEYEKFLTLYDQSEAAAYAQLRWSECQVALRQSNTAISDGFQSVIDYWPESPEAIVAAYEIGATYKGMGRVPQAKKALRSVVKDHPEHLASTYALNDLIDLAQQEQDQAALLEHLKQLTFDVKRGKANARICQNASHTLASLLFTQGAFGEGVKSLATSYDDAAERDARAASLVVPALRELAKDDTRAQCDKLAGEAISHFSREAPTGEDEASRAAALQYWLQIAQVHEAAAHKDEVPQVYEQIFKRLGPNDEILRRLAQWHKSQDEFDKARAVYRRFADKLAGLAEVAYSYRQQSNIESAVSTYNQLVAEDSENAIQWQAEIAASYRGGRQYQQAIEQYESLLAADIENAERWRWQIATAYEDWGKLPEAIGHYRQCTNFPENYKRMAACQRRLKKPGEAIVLYNQVMAHEPSAPWALLQIGYTREEADQKEQAIKTFQLVCKRFPTDQHASTAHAHLQNKYKISVTLGGAKDE
ncbi:MAG: tetratricopeptide repeat protein [Planctomycetales bacterium]|nr:tetratricopeptide repeat protein [Planctomycetales bacterium]